MNLLPYITYTILTDLTTAEVRERLSEQIEPKDNWRYVRFVNKFYSSKPYEGYVLNNKFKIKRIALLNYRYPTLVKGTFAELENETAIDIAIWLSWFTCFFIFIVLCLDVFLIALLVKESLNSGVTEPIVYFFMAIVNVIGIGIPMYVFRLESAKAQKFLSELLHEKNSKR